jgi:putative membrane protein
MPQGFLYAGYLVFWSAMAVSPLDRENWILSSVLPFALIAALVLGRRALPLSTISCASIVAFLMLHTVGAHYTYAQVPIGVWLQHAFDLQRNHFDRVTHFAFGLLFTYPLFEGFQLRLRDGSAGLAYYVTFMTQLGLAGAWEIIEAVVAQVAHPELGMAFVGSQGDVWDAQHDMLAATCGTVLALLAIAICRRWAGQRSPAIEPGDHMFAADSAVPTTRPTTS